MTLLLLTQPVMWIWANRKSLTKKKKNQKNVPKRHKKQRVMVSLSKSFEDCLAEESQESLAGGTWYNVECGQWGNLRGIQSQRGTGNFWKPWPGKPGACRTEGHLILQREGAWRAQALDHVTTTQTKRRGRHFRENCLLWGVRKTLVPLNRVNFPSRGRNWKFLFYKEGIVHQLIPIIFSCFLEEQKGSTVLARFSHCRFCFWKWALVCWVSPSISMCCPSSTPSQPLSPASRVWSTLG